MLPATGLTLPFLSYGGSSLVANMIAIGLVESVIMRRKVTES
jgi:rod shape determining protein RodA